jgi:hypothetical protein
MVVELDWWRTLCSKHRLGHCADDPFCLDSYRGPARQLTHRRAAVLHQRMQPARRPAARTLTLPVTSCFAALAARDFCRHRNSVLSLLARPPPDSRSAMKPRMRPSHDC